MDYYDLLLSQKLNGGGGGGGGITPEIKQALLACFSKVAWVDENGQDYYDTLASAFYSPADLVSISAVYSGGAVNTSTSLNDLKADLVVTASWNDESTSTIGADYYALSGTLVEGTSTVTVTYLSKTTTFNVTVTSGHAYELASPLTSNGSQSINTGLYYPASGSMTIAEEFVITSFAFATKYIFGTKINGSQNYLALQVQNSSGNHLWGVGIPWDAGNNIVSTGQTVRMVHVFTFSDNGEKASVTAYFKNVTSDTSNTYSNTYTALTGQTYDTNPIVIGNPYDNLGFAGTLNKFIIDNDAWSSTDINAFLAG